MELRKIDNGKWFGSSVNKNNNNYNNNKNNGSIDKKKTGYYCVIC